MHRTKLTAAIAWAMLSSPKSSQDTAHVGNSYWKRLMGTMSSLIVTCTFTCTTVEAQQGFKSKLCLGWNDRIAKHLEAARVPRFLCRIQPSVHGLCVQRVPLGHTMVSRSQALVILQHGLPSKDLLTVTQQRMSQKMPL